MDLEHLKTICFPDGVYRSHRHIHSCRRSDVCGVDDRGPEAVATVEVGRERVADLIAEDGG